MTTEPELSHNFLNYPKTSFQGVNITTIFLKRYILQWKNVKKGSVD